MISETFARNQLMRLSGLPYFDKLASVVFADLVSALRQSDSEELCRKAVENLLEDLTERPTLSQVRGAVQSLKVANVQPAASHDYCGRLVDGKTYLSHDPSTPVTKAQWDGLEDIPKFLLPARCVRGWIHWTEWLPVKPARVYEDGSPVTQAYEYSGRCKCQPGGWV